MSRRLSILLCVLVTLSCSVSNKKVSNISETIEAIIPATSVPVPRITGEMPEPRFSPAMAYDNTRSVIVLFGGSTKKKTLIDTWEYDGYQWKMIDTDAPEPDFAPAMTYDEKRHKMVLLDWQSVALWEYSKQKWEHISISTQLSHITWPDIAYNPTLEKVVIFGEWDAGKAYETWLYDGVSLQRIDSSHPYYDWGVRGQYYDRIFFPSLVYDRNNREMILQPPFKWTFVLKNNTWEIQLSEEQSTLPDCVYCIWPKMVYDTKRNLIVMFDGENTWELIDGNWTRIETPISPPRRTGHAMAYDQARSVTVLFGGETQDGTLLNDLWEYDGTTWVQR
jgi:hypothetical protein